MEVQSSRDVADSLLNTFTFRKVHSRVDLLVPAG